MEVNKSKTILVITSGFLVLGLFTISDWPFYVALGVGVLSIISDRVTDLIIWVWFGIAKILGFINSRILLTIIYYLILLPMALISRLANSNNLILKKNDTSYFTIRDHQYKKSDLEKPW